MESKYAFCVSNIRDQVDKALINIKQNLEKLGVGFNTPLVDKDGFPLPDVDHFQIAYDRRHALRLLNDRKRLDYILGKLVETVPLDDDDILLSVLLERENAFALITDIRPDSPAETSGLQEGDFVIKFGNARKMADVKDMVKEYQLIHILIIRAEEGHEIKKFEVELFPKKYDGEGLVGCRLVPF